MGPLVSCHLEAQMTPAHVAGAAVGAASSDGALSLWD